MENPKKPENSENRKELRDEQLEQVSGGLDNSEEPRRRKVSGALRLEPEKVVLLSEPLRPPMQPGQETSSLL